MFQFLEISKTWTAPLQPVRWHGEVICEDIWEAPQKSRRAKKIGTKAAYVSSGLHIINPQDHTCQHGGRVRATSALQPALQGSSDMEKSRTNYVVDLLEQLHDIHHYTYQQISKRGQWKDEGKLWPPGSISGIVGRGASLVTSPIPDKASHPSSNHFRKAHTTIKTTMQSIRSSDILRWRYQLCTLTEWHHI
jgi:hypothetical protein